MSRPHTLRLQKGKMRMYVGARALKDVLVLDEKCLSERYLGPEWFQSRSESLKWSRLEPCAFHLSPKVGMQPNCSWMICLISPQSFRVKSCSLTSLTPLDLFVLAFSLFWSSRKTESDNVNLKALCYSHVSNCLRLAASALANVSVQSRPIWTHSQCKTNRTEWQLKGGDL